MRANNPGDLCFLDHVDISVDQYIYCVLVIIDAASNLVWAVPQKSKLHEEALSSLEQAWNDLNMKPKAVCGDQYFMLRSFKNTTSIMTLSGSS